MVRYRRNLIPGQTFFFTVALSDRRASTLTDNIPALRAAFRKARAEHPFTIEAIVILPDHLHAILTLPDADTDTDTAQPWRRIKPSSPTPSCTPAKPCPSATTPAAAFGKGASGNTRSATPPISNPTPPTSTKTP